MFFKLFVLLITAVLGNANSTTWGFTKTTIATEIANTNIDRDDDDIDNYDEDREHMEDVMAGMGDND